ncbi:hypothetical protein JCM21900_002797 [Sporobolomyces salmonicolor]
MRCLIICCDGTWHSALYQTESSMLTNISRLYTAIERRGMAYDLPVEQLKLYLPGVGTGEELAGGIVAGTMGDGLLEKVREAYYWLAQNYEQGDEIQLYGFSRGAYICRLLGSFISIVGILNPKSNLSRFPRHPPSPSKPLCLSDEKLEPQLEIALQALSINENRPACTPILLRQDEVVPGQKLLQIRTRADVGGGYPQRDHSDLSLNWLVSLVQEYLALDLSNISNISNLSARPAAPCGQLKPHHGFGHSLHAHDRPLPHGSEYHTQQYYHASILEPSHLNLPRKIRPILEDPEAPLFFPLTPFEQKRKISWPISSAPPSSPVSDPPGSPSPAASEPASPANASASPFHPAFRPAAPSPPVVSASSASASTLTPYSPSSRHRHVHLTHLRQTRRILRTISGEEHRLVQAVKVKRAKIRAAGVSPGEARAR